MDRVHRAAACALDGQLLRSRPRGAGSAPPVEMTHLGGEDTLPEEDRTCRRRRRDDRGGMRRSSCAGRLIRRERITAGRDLTAGRWARALGQVRRDWPKLFTERATRRRGGSTSGCPMAKAIRRWKGARRANDRQRKGAGEAGPGRSGHRRVPVGSGPPSEAAGGQREAKKPKIEHRETANFPGFPRTAPTRALFEGAIYARALRSLERRRRLFTQCQSA